MQTVIHSKNWLRYHCPGCGGHHAIPVLINHKEEKSWNWDGDLEKPTVRPSVKHFYPDSAYKQNPGLPKFCCHYHITKGVIEYCGDCTHQHNAKNIVMTPFSEAEVKMESMDA